jgi:hypothetical protein
MLKIPNNIECLGLNFSEFKDLLRIYKCKEPKDGDVLYLMGGNTRVMRTNNRTYKLVTNDSREYIHIDAVHLLWVLQDDLEEFKRIMSDYK